VEKNSVTGQLVGKFYGATFGKMNGVNASLNSFTVGNIEATYTVILDELMIRFAAQAPLSQLLNGASAASVENNPMLAFASIKSNIESDTIVVDFDQLIKEVIERAPTAGSQISYYDLAARLIRSLRVDLFNKDKISLTNAFITARQCGVP
jgi:hypothetical protein